MTMEQASSALEGVSPDTIALAYAVAALQNVQRPLPGSKTRDSTSPVAILPTPSSKEQCRSSPSGNLSADDADATAADRLAKSRERNREHAKRTRLRKKQQLQVLQSKIRTLEAERQTLKQSLRDCSIANILLGLSGIENSEPGSVEADIEAEDETARKVQMLTCGKRKRLMSEEENLSSETTSTDLIVTIDGKETSIGGGNKSQINWKTGTVTQENGGTKQLTPEELEALRRERNRRHAKMTRDRKKNFCQLMQKTVDELEAENSRMRQLISQRVTPSSSPVMSGQPDPQDEVLALFEGIVK